MKAVAVQAPKLVNNDKSWSSQPSLRLDELEGLPPELVAELSISESDKTEYAIIRIIEDCGGMAAIDRILVNLFRHTGEIHKRNTLTSRLYRMAQKGEIFAVPSKKGFYSTREPEQDESICDLA